MVRERFVAFAQQQQRVNGRVRAEEVLPNCWKDEITRMGLSERVNDGSELFRDHGCGCEREGGGRTRPRLIYESTSTSCGYPPKPRGGTGSHGRFIFCQPSIVSEMIKPLPYGRT